MRNVNVICALIGLMGAINNNGKTENTDEVVREAILSEESAEIIEKIKREKYTISPSCETCEHPCGNTSDYDPQKFADDSDEIKAVKNEVAIEIEKMVRECEGEIPELVYKAISYLGYEMREESYTNLLEEFRK